MQSEYLLVLGSNHRRARALRLAVQRLRCEFEVLACSGVSRTRDASGPRYLNAAMRIAADSKTTPEMLKQQLRAIEAAAGRVRGGSVCELDIDLVAACIGTRLIAIYKPDDLQRDYLQPLLQSLAIEVDAVIIETT